MAAEKSIEQKAWRAGGETQVAPAQRMIDFVEGKLSSSLPECSYPPGIVSSRVDELLPEDITKRLQIGLRAFGKLFDVAGQSINRQWTSYLDGLSPNFSRGTRSSASS